MPAAVLPWAGEEGLPVQAFARPSVTRRRSAELPADVESAIWRGDEMGTRLHPVLSSGFDALDRELPGGGWPCGALTEILSPQPSVLEWRLVGPSLRSVVAKGAHVVVVGPPKLPHLPGLRHAGLDAQHLVWVQAQAPAERLWAAEQLLRAKSFGALLAWLPQARPEQIRRLQVAAQACEGPVLLFRPAAAQHEASAAPLRVMASFGLDWELQIHVLKRRGPVHEGQVHLASVPGGLASILTPRLQHPSRMLTHAQSQGQSHRAPVRQPRIATEAHAHAPPLVGIDAAPRTRRHAPTP